MFSNAIKKIANLMAFWSIQYREALNALEKPIDQNREPVVFDHAVVELFGHRRIEGTVTRIGHGAATLYRVVNERSYTIVSPKSIYAITDGETAPDSEPTPSHGRAVSAEAETEEEDQSDIWNDLDRWDRDLRAAIVAHFEKRPIGLDDAWMVFREVPVGEAQRCPNYADVARALKAIEEEEKPL